MGLSLTFFLEGWTGVVSKHLLTEEIAIPYVQASFKMGLDKVGASSCYAAATTATAATTAAAIAKAAAKGSACCGKKKGAAKDEQGLIDPSSLFGNDVLRRMQDFGPLSAVPAVRATCHVPRATCAPSARCTLLFCL